MTTLHPSSQDFIYNKELKEKLLSFLEGHLDKVSLHDQQQAELIEDTIQLVFTPIIRYVTDIVYLWYSKLKEMTSPDVNTDKSLPSMLMKTIQVHMCVVPMTTVYYGYYDNRLTAMKRC